MGLGYPCCGSLKTGVHVPGCPVLSARAGGVVPQKVRRGDVLAGGHDRAATETRQKKRRAEIQAFMARRCREVQHGEFRQRQQLVYMADCRGWVMARVPGCVPFVIAEAEWAALPRWSLAGAPEGTSP